MAVIYDHPRDFPDHFVVREHHITAGGRCMPSLVSHQFDTLEEARDHARQPHGKICIARHPKDDPVIVESWV